MRRQLITLLVLGVVSACSQAPENAASPRAWPLAGTKADETPDFMQTSHPELPGGGSNYCAPVSASNGLVYLGEHGFPRLLPSGGDREDVQLALIKRLASSRYMGTDPDNGTDPAEVLVGLEAYVQDEGYTVETLAYQGWRPHDDRFDGGARRPDLAWLRAYADGSTTVLLNVGWYARTRNGFERHGGHWVTLVGFDRTADGDEALVIHDPQPRSGAEPRSERVTWTVVAGGKLTGSDRGLPQPARGYLELGGELQHARTAVLDGAVALRL